MVIDAHPVKIRAHGIGVVTAVEENDRDARLPELRDQLMVDAVLFIDKHALYGREFEAIESDFLVTLAGG
jgi:hypothetical protein